MYAMAYRDTAIVAVPRTTAQGDPHVWLFSLGDHGGGGGASNLLQLESPTNFSIPNFKEQMAATLLADRYLILSDEMNKISLEMPSAIEALDVQARQWVSRLDPQNQTRASFGFQPTSAASPFTSVAPRNAATGEQGGTNWTGILVGSILAAAILGFTTGILLYRALQRRGKNKAGQLPYTSARSSSSHDVPPRLSLAIEASGESLIDAIMQEIGPSELEPRVASRFREIFPPTSSEPHLPKTLPPIG
ncbi:uncharacterized protein VTP21DRAFT_9174 [Calcarisporiella thermophila]|uniref:uncharacterized protein n=1 Tax=Calcarisporiella thermophila TaxID=911321 RepID=UPI003743870C